MMDRSSLKLLKEANKRSTVKRELTVTQAVYGPVNEVLK
jgi:hypothetical protein